MKKLNRKEYAGTRISTGKFPGSFAFDNLREEDIPFLEKIGLGHVVIEVCDKCEHEKCKCKKVRKSKEDKFDLIKKEVKKYTEDDISKQ